MSKKKVPSDFNGYPYGSVTRKSEAETVANNVMKILKRTGDKFRPLSWDEYKEEREKDGNFSEKEKAFFLDVVKYFKSAETAVLFSGVWEH